MKNVADRPVAKCCTCGEMKPHYPNNNGGHQSRCVDCRRATMATHYSPEKYQANKDKHLEASWAGSLKRKYDITVEEYNVMLVAQDGKCAICGCTPKARLAVDHCHKTNKVRGLLCTRCNRAISAFEDNPDLLAAAAAYLRGE